MRYLAGVALISIAAIVICLAVISTAWIERDRVRYEGQAAIIRAESSARFQDAQSTAVIVSSLFPIVALVAGTIVVSAIAFSYQRGGRHYGRVIERHIVMLPPDTPRREIWRLMSEGQQFRLLESPDEKKLPAYNQIDN